MIDNQTKLVFISYSRVKLDYVRSIVDRLCGDGVQVIFDQYDLKHGNHLTPYMEQAVNNPDVDYVLVFSDKSYTEKANGRIGGVGVESTILSQEVYNSIQQEKVIPILIECDGGNPCLPIFLKDLYHFDFTKDDFEKQYESLLRMIYNKPEMRKPKLGKPPAWLDDETVDYSIIRTIINSNRPSNVVSDHTFYDELSKVLRELVESDISKIESYMDVIDKEKICRDLVVDFFIKSIGNREEVGSRMGDLLEHLDNSLTFVNDHPRQDLATFFKWEFAVIFVALLLKYEQYHEFSILIKRTYFAKECGRSKIRSFFDYEDFCRYFENDLKSYLDSKKISTQADLLVGRTYVPFFDSNDISSADLILYHLSFFSKNKSYWFPRTYIYLNGTIDFWAKMQSYNHCLKLFELFEVKDIESLKKVISEVEDPCRHYMLCFNYAPWITDFISLDEIGRYN